MGVLACAAVTVVMLLQLPTSYWFDEANTIFYVQQPLPRMLTYVANDFSPPAYYLLLRGWTALVGTSEAATGSLSLLVVWVTAALTYGLGRRLFTRAAAAWGTLLFLVSQATIYYATETRMYALLMALTVASTWLLVRLLQEPRGWGAYLGYAATVLLGVYTHYAFWFFVLAQNVAVVLWLRSRTAAPRFGRWVVVQCSLLAAYLPQIPILFDRVLHWYLAPGADWVDAVPADISLFWRLPLELLLPSIPDFSQSRTAAALLIGAAAVMIFVVVRFDRPRRAVRLEFRPLDPGVALLVVLTLIPLGVLYGLNVQFYRYAAYLAPLLCLLLAYGAVTSASRIIGTILPITLVLMISGINFVTMLGLPPHVQDAAWPAVAAFLQTQPATPRTIIAAHYDDGITLGVYYRGLLPIVKMVPLDLAFDGDRTVAEIRRIKKYTIQSATAPDLIPLLQSATEVWYVTGAGESFYDPAHAVGTLLEQLCDHDRPREFFASSRLQYGVVQVTHFRNCQYSPPRTSGI